MKKRLLKHFAFVGLILLITAGCSTNREYIKKMVHEEVKSELKGVSDFLNVAYAYDDPKALDNIFRMDETIKSVRYDMADIRTKMKKGAYGGGIDLEEINKKIESELSRMDQQIELRLVRVDDEIGIRLATIDDNIDKKIKGKLSKFQENVEDNRMRIKEFRLDIKSNSIDITSNKLDIRGNRHDFKENRQNILENKKNILAQKADIADDINTNHRNIKVNRNDITELKRSSARLLLNINNAK
ncbi:MAG: hypothetical protein JRI91_10850 [Deltaproteobacteria bacterium]|nr:hypothetical protein [Deltaproteobacteria bacterium]